MVVVTPSGVPMLGGMVIWGSTDWILLLMNTSLTKDAMRLDLPVPSSPQTQTRTMQGKGRGLVSACAGSNMSLEGREARREERGEGKRGRGEGKRGRGRSEGSGWKKNRYWDTG